MRPSVGVAGRAAAEAPPLLRFEIARHGRPLFATDESVWVDFKAKAMIDWREFQPTLAIYQAVAAERRRLERHRGPG